MSYRPSLGRQLSGADFAASCASDGIIAQAQGFTFKAVISVIVAGCLGALWLGIKVMLGK
jgi:hypothetical protein